MTASRGPFTPGIVSVVIPCYKQSAYVASAVRSCLDQTAGGVQVVVVDDGSPDDSAAVVAGFGDRVTLVRQANAGVAAARNAGLARATGEFVAFLDADDVLLPEMADTHVRAMRATGADATCSGWRAVRADGSLFDERPAPAFDPDPFHALLPVNLNPPVCYLFRRAAVDAVGGFDPDRRLSGHEDWDLFLRLATAGYRFVPVPEVLAEYRLHPQSASTRFAKMYDSGMAVLAKARAAHRPCEKCGTRFADAARRFRDEYVTFHLTPALRKSPLAPAGRAAWRHAAGAAVADPALVAVVARRFAGAAARHVGLLRRR